MGLIKELSFLYCIFKNNIIENQYTGILILAFRNQLPYKVGGTLLKTEKFGIFWKFINF